MPPSSPTDNPAPPIRGCGFARSSLRVDRMTLRFSQISAIISLLVIGLLISGCSPPAVNPTQDQTQNSQSAAELMQAAIEARDWQMADR